MRIKNVTALKEQIDHQRPLVSDIMSTLAQKFREEWTYHTNGIEGNTMTLQETSFILREGLTAKGKTLREHFEVINHGEAIDYLQGAIRERDLSEGLIKDVHAMLFEGVKSWAPGLRIVPGAYKVQDNHVLTPSREIHYYTPAVQVPLEMEKLLEWLTVSLPTVHPIRLAGDFHHRFVAIHPFQDGNGRVGRICMNFILMKAGYPPAIIRKEERLDYILALEQVDKGNNEPFFELILSEVERSLLLMEESIERHINNGS